MSDIFNEVFGRTETTYLTPIEIALGVDGNGMTTAKRLYEFLELDMSNYAKWFRRNILENDFAEENTDYWVFVPKDENTWRGRPTQDAKLTAHFAKKLSVKGNGERAEQAREYFARLEERVKEVGRSRFAPGDQYPSPQIDSAVLKGVSSLGNLIRNTMKDEKAKPYETAIVLDSLFRQAGLILPEQFIQVPEYKQMKLRDFME